MLPPSTPSSPGLPSSSLANNFFYPQCCGTVRVGTLWSSRRQPCCFVCASPQLQGHASEGFFGITLPFPHFKFLQIGHFPMDPSIVTTFELHLTIQVLLYSQYILKSLGVLPLAIYFSYENTCTGKHGGDDPSPPDPDQHRAQDRRQTHAGLKILFCCFCILVFEGSH